MKLMERIDKIKVAQSKRKRMLGLMKKLKNGELTLATIEGYGYYLCQGGNNGKIPNDDNSACRCQYNGRTYVLNFGNTNDNKGDHAGVAIAVFSTPTADPRGGNIRVEISAKVGENEVKAQTIHFVNEIRFQNALDSSEPESYFNDIIGLLASSMLYTLSTYVKEQDLP